MEKGIFRKSALDRMASMEQLDQTMTVIKPSNVLALISVAIILAVALFWGITGSIPDNVTGSGILVNKGQITSIKYSNQGTIKNVFVDKGDTVEIGQIIARIERQDMLDQILVLENKLQGLQKMKETIDSSNKGNQQKQALMKQLYDQGLITQAEYLNSRQTEVNLDQQIVEMKQQILVQREEYRTATQVFSYTSGIVMEVPVRKGDFVQPGNTIILVQDENTENVFEALIYFPINEGKKIRPNMKIGIVPSTVKQEEFGYIQGLVTSVSDFPVSNQSLLGSLQNESLAAIFAQKGPLIEVKVSLIPDSSTYSGYKWSSSKGPEQKINAGFLCSAVVTTDKKKPIELVIPTLKRNLLGIGENSIKGKNGE